MAAQVWVVVSSQFVVSKSVAVGHTCMQVDLWWQCGSGSCSAVGICSRYLKKCAPGLYSYTVYVWQLKCTHVNAVLPEWGTSCSPLCDQHLNLWHNKCHVPDRQKKFPDQIYLPIESF